MSPPSKCVVGAGAGPMGILVDAVAGLARHSDVSVVDLRQHHNEAKNGVPAAAGSVVLAHAEQNTAAFSDFFRWDFERADREHGWMLELRLRLRDAATGVRLQA